MEITNIAFEVNSESFVSVFEKCLTLEREGRARKIYLLSYFMPAGIEKTLFPGKDGPSISRINVGEVMAYDLLRENSFLSPSDMTYILLEDYLSEDDISYFGFYDAQGRKKYTAIDLCHRREISFSSRCLDYIISNPRTKLKDVLANIKE